MKVGFIGFGNMAQALAEGFAATGALKPCQIGACARDRAKLRRNTEPKGFLAFDDAARVAEFADMVIVAVKPHQVEAVLSPVKELLAGKIVVSVAAGMTFGKYETILAPGTHHLSTVPNTPVAVGEGIVVCERLHSLSDAEWKETERLFSHVGLVMQVDTPLLGLAGTICGCGPAFVAMFIDPTCEAGRLASHGLPVYAACAVFFALNISFIGYYQSIERAAKAMLFTLMRGVILLVPLFLIMPSIWPVYGIWAAIPLREALTRIAIGATYLLGRRHNR